jgi:ABC-type Fe3+/spermidine/putrescine transport system ATPase subunit
MCDGHELQAGTVSEIFNHPASPDVARFLGMTNIFAAVVVAPDALEVEGTRLRVATTLAPGTLVTCSVRPELVRLRPVGGAGDTTPVTWRGTVGDIADLGTASIVFVEVGDVEIQARASDSGGLRVGDECDVEFADGSLSLWPVTSREDPASPLGTSPDMRA